MDAKRRDAVLAELDDLEQRDCALADSLRELSSLTDEVQSLRATATDIVGALERLPADREAAGVEQAQAREALIEATRAHVLASAAVAELEGARKNRADELERARKELQHATNELHDASNRSERAGTRVAELADVEVALRASAEGLVVTARGLASRLQTAPRVTDAGKGAPGATVVDLDDWGGRARAALFVAHSTLATERERVLHEANALGAVVLGEDTGAVSVALVRRQLAERL